MFVRINVVSAWTGQQSRPLCGGTARIWLKSTPLCRLYVNMNPHIRTALRPRCKESRNEIAGDSSAPPAFPSPLLAPGEERPGQVYSPLHFGCYWFSYHRFWNPPAVASYSLTPSPFGQWLPEKPLDSPIIFMLSFATYHTSVLAQFLISPTIF